MLLLLAALIAARARYAKAGAALIEMINEVAQFLRPFLMGA